MKTVAGLCIMSAAVAAALLGAAPASRAGSYGNAPWCAVTNIGTGDVIWDCEYASAAQCQPQVLAGNRGFCNLNPRWTPSAFAAPPRYRYKHHHG